MAWGKRQKLASRALGEGDIEGAIELLGHEPLGQSFQGRRFARRLTQALIERASNSISLGNLALAWKDLSYANQIAVSKDADVVSRQLNQLVELTVEAADSFLANGKVTHAVQLIDQLTDRKIMDWRADRIRNVVDCLQKAETLAATGKFKDSLLQLEQAKNIQPDLPFIESRISACSLRKIQMKELNEELQSAALKCQWADVNEVCSKILAIAPKHQIAIDAQKHCLTQIKRKTNSGLRATQIPDKGAIGNSFFQFNSVANPQKKSQNNPQNGTRDSLQDDTNSEPVAKTNSFQLWVDGVGGYLVCVDKVNTIGQATPNANISIPVIGDLRRRHARLETVAGQHVLHGLGGGIAVDGEVLDVPVELKHEQVIELDGGVKMKYTQSHPLSKSARLDFVSRHRTQPWSDAIVLAGQSVVLGPNRDNHIFCPIWRMDVIIFQRKGKWFCRAKEPFEIDGKQVEKEGEIQFDSRIVGEDFSVTLEPVI